MAELTTGTRPHLALCAYQPVDTFLLTIETKRRIGQLFRCCCTTAKAITYIDIIFCRRLLFSGQIYRFPYRLVPLGRFLEPPSDVGVRLEYKRVSVFVRRSVDPVDQFSTRFMGLVSHLIRFIFLRLCGYSRFSKLVPLFVILSLFVESIRTLVKTALLHVFDFVDRLTLIEITCPGFWAIVELPMVPKLDSQERGNWLA